MLSILIPIYNQEVVPLVDTLQKQCVRSKINYEILCYDDCSKEEYKQKNAVLAGYFGVNYTELSHNLGRSKIRNWLAKTASYDNLLFLDCDAKVSGRKFIGNYIEHLGSSKVISGGRSYSRKAPRAKSKQLHWLYGCKRESKSARYRTKFPYLFFHSNNFVIDRNLMLDIAFDESLMGYGYEDLFLAKALKEKSIKIKHIDNPVQHIGLEKSKTFLKKTENAIKNLTQLKKANQGIDTRLELWASKLEYWKLKGLFNYFYRKWEPQIMNNLISASPKIRYFDAFKLYTYYRYTNELESDKRKKDH